MKLTKKQLTEIISEAIEECMGMGMMGGDAPVMKKMPAITLSLGGDKNEEEESYDADGRMANSNVYNLMKHAAMLSNLIDDNDDLEPWVQEKIAVATEAIETVAEYLEYEKTRRG